jgi:hypothetical protein
MGHGGSRYAPAIAAGLILAAVCLGWLLMPSLMRAISGGGPLAGLAVAILFILAFFAIFWLRTRYLQRRG